MEFPNSIIKYKLASDLLDAMIKELTELGFNEENNWGINP